jgi:fatty acid desaturase
VESNRIIRWLLWETNFHCEHHAYPMVPFYNLSVLHDLLDPYIKHNDCKTFTGQNWQMIKPGGWIDKQNS